MNLNEVNIVGLEDVYNTLKKASKANVPGLSGNTALGKNLVLKVLTALNDGKCDYKSAIDAIENIFIYGTKKEVRTNKPKYQDEQSENESMKVREALNILKENGYILSEVKNKNKNEDEDIDIFQELYDGIYCHWLDSDASCSDLADAFYHGMEDDIDWEDYSSYLEEEYRMKDIEYIEIAYQDGLDFGTCKSKKEIRAMLDDKLDY